MLPYDTNVALAGFGLAKFLYADTGHGIEEEVALMLYHQGMASLAVHALLRPFDAWSSTDFRSAGNIFWAVSVVDHTPAWDKELEEFVNSKGYDKTTGVAHTTIKEIQEKFGKQMAEDPEPEFQDGTSHPKPYHILPEQPCR